MKKLSRKPKIKPATLWSGMAYTVAKVDDRTFEYEGLAFKIEEGIIVNVERITRAPDLPKVAGSRAYYHMFATRDQQSE
jgi:hypothetical protein